MEEKEEKKKLTTLKILQWSVIIVFILMVALGVVVLFLMPDKLPQFKVLIDTILPVFLMQVIPALIGGPLTEAVRAQAQKKET